MAKNTRGPAGPPKVVQLVPRDDAKLIADAIAEMNEAYAVTLAGAKTVVLREYDEKDPKTGKARTSWMLMRVLDFHIWTANRKIMIEDKPYPLSKLWIAHEQRRQYDGIEFAPNRELDGKYNLWCGFAVEPKEGDCSLYLNHLRDNVCQAYQDHYDWLLGWMAQLVQQPEVKMGTSVVLRGDEGIGKSKVGEVLGSLFPDHHVVVTQAEHMTGRFNAHIARCLLLQAEEALWAGDKKGESVLKTMITGDTHMVEFKFIDPVPVRNFLRLLITSNSRWVVPVGLRGRRFFVLDVGEKQIGNKPYFAAIDAQMDNGGREALLHFLLNYDYSKVDLRTVPPTAALLEQKIFSMTPEEQWWFDVLMRGKMPARQDSSAAGGTAYSKADLYDSYIQHANKTGIKRRAIETAIGMFLRKVTPWMKSAQQRTFAGEDRTARGEGLIFPILEKCRAEFAEHLGQAVEWGDDRRYWD